MDVYDRSRPDMIRSGDRRVVLYHGGESHQMIPRKPLHRAPGRINNCTRSMTPDSTNCGSRGITAATVQSRSNLMNFPDLLWIALYAQDQRPARADCCNYGGTSSRGHSALDQINTTTSGSPPAWIFNGDYAENLTPRIVLIVMIFISARAQVNG